MSQGRCTLLIRGLDCPAEVEVLRTALQDHPGVGGLAFDLIYGTITVDYVEGVVDPEELIRVIVERTGFPTSVQGKPERSAMKWWSSHERWVFTAGSGLALSLGLVFSWLGPLLRLRYPVAERLALVGYGSAVVIAGIELFPRAARNIRRLRFDIDVLMGLAILGALCLGQWEEAATVAFLFGLSESLEGLSLDRARRSIRALLELAPPTAERIARDGTVQPVHTSALRKGDRILIRAGDTIPVDGVVAAGRSSVDQKTITGESVLVVREMGDRVYAGTINGDGTLEVAASSPVGDAVISRVVAQVRAVQAGRAPIERRISRFAAVYTPLVVGLSFLVMVVPPLMSFGAGAEIAGNRGVWRDWFERGLVVLVIACPCPLVIATPVAIVCGLAAAARAGVLIRGVSTSRRSADCGALETFDKTGTLTRAARPDVVEIVCAPGQGDEAEVLRIAAALGDRGGHVLGKAIARHARGLSLEVPVADGYTAIPGLGALGRVDAVEYHLGSHRYIDEAGLCPPEFHAQLDQAEKSVGSAVALTATSGPLGWIRLADRRVSKATVTVLGRIAPAWPSDHHADRRQRGDEAAAMGEELGVGEQRAGLVPADKVSAIAELDLRHGPTGMVGDGVNDAPALAAAPRSASRWEEFPAVPR